MKKGTWVTHHQVLTSKKVLGERVPVIQSECDLKVEKVHDSWLPTYAKIRSLDTVVEIYFTWHPTNEVLEQNFTIDHVRSLIQLDKERLEVFKSERD